MKRTTEAVEMSTETFMPVGVHNASILLVRTRKTTLYMYIDFGVNFDNCRWTKDFNQTQKK